MKFLLAALLSMLCAAPGVLLAQCSAMSGTQRVALLELYTSEGCDSCPPVDQWVSSLPARYAVDRLVVLGFHVDYWNYLGWPDPFARRSFTERQQAASARNHMRFVYTPQLLLDGRDLRRAARDDIGERIAALNRRSPAASIRLDLEPEAQRRLSAKIAVALKSNAPGSVATYVALYENNLATQVSRGENRGKRLEHDFVVRELAGPFQIPLTKRAKIDHTFRLAGDWKLKDLHVSAFVQDLASGEVLQAIARRACF